MKTELAPIDFALWQSDTFPGRVRIAFPVASPKLIAGMLEIDPAFLDIAAVLQTRHPNLSGNPVFEARIDGESCERALHVLSRQEAESVPHARILEIRDGAGRTRKSSLVSIMRLPHHLLEYGELVDLCRARAIPVSPWMVSATKCESDAGAP